MRDPSSERMDDEDNDDDDDEEEEEEQEQEEGEGGEVDDDEEEAPMMPSQWQALKLAGRCVYKCTFRWLSTLEPGISHLCRRAGCPVLF